MDTSGIEGLFVVLIILMIVLVACSVILGTVYGVTCIWKETTMQETFEVEVVDKIMTKTTSGSIQYYILVKGTLPNGETYCDEQYVNSDEYSCVEDNDILHMEVKETQQPIFGRKRFYTLVF